jgi:hypothetical protein
MDNIELMYYLRDAVAFLGVLIGLGSAVFLFIRKKPLSAGLALAGFIFLGIEPFLDVLLWRILSYQENANYNSLNSIYACVSGPTMFLGIGMLVLAFVLGFREPKLPPPPIDSSSSLPPL